MKKLFIATFIGVIVISPKPHLNANEADFDTCVGIALADYDNLLDTADNVFSTEMNAALAYANQPALENAIEEAASNLTVNGLDSAHVGLEITKDLEAGTLTGAEVAETGGGVLAVFAADVATNYLIDRPSDQQTAQLIQDAVNGYNFRQDWAEDQANYDVQGCADDYLGS